MQEIITYFETAGKTNTDGTLILAKNRALKRKIQKVVIATSRGFTPPKALAVFHDSNIQLVIVADNKKLSNTLISQFKRVGHQWIFGGAATSHDYYPIIARNTLKRLCEGLKVCVEIVLLAADAGLLSPRELVVSIAGTGYLGFQQKGGGADTAIVMEAIDSQSFFDVSSDKASRRKIREIICKPL